MCDSAQNRRHPVAFSDVLGVVSSILLVIAVITLINGCIGIVNIRLVSVTELIWR